jgi:hypothetical protein
VNAVLLLQLWADSYLYLLLSSRVAGHFADFTWLDRLGRGRREAARDSHDLYFGDTTTTAALWQ